MRWSLLHSVELKTLFSCSHPLAVSTTSVTSQEEPFMPKKQRQEDLGGVFFGGQRQVLEVPSSARCFTLLSRDMPYAVTLHCPSQLLQIHHRASLGVSHHRFFFFFFFLVSCHKWMHPPPHAQTWCKDLYTLGYICFNNKLAWTTRPIWRLAPSEKGMLVTGLRLR